MEVEDHQVAKQDVTLQPPLPLDSAGHWPLVSRSASFRVCFAHHLIISSSLLTAAGSNFPPFNRHSNLSFVLPATFFHPSRHCSSLSPPPS